MGSAVIKAILWLCAALPMSQARLYAQHITVQADRRGIDPLLVVALVYMESRFNKNVHSRTNDYGLMQLHVASDTHAKYIGKEHLLLEPKRNIRLGVKMLHLWKKYHFTRCKNPSAHPWWSHYQWGSRVRNPASGKRVARIYERLRGRFLCRQNGKMLSAMDASGAVGTKTSGSSTEMSSVRYSGSYGQRAQIRKTGSTNGAGRFLVECTLQKELHGSI